MDYANGKIDLYSCDAVIEIEKERESAANAKKTDEFNVNIHRKWMGVEILSTFGKLVTFIRKTNSLRHMHS